MTIMANEVSKSDQQIDLGRSKERLQFNKRSDKGNCELLRIIGCFSCCRVKDKAIFLL